ncbi:hypothetical protein [Saccharopolyspora hattusasensis]|uniref:hypothetical protein n=1 Tax=Saccharopolyspora hattusasensis TaxID=1128679 RepID=UPI003D96DE03
MALARTSGLVLWTVGVLAGGCASTPDPGPEPSEPSIAPPPGRYTGERAAVEGVYREFWRISWVSHDEPDAQWENELRRVTSGNLASHISSTARQQRAEGTGLYGEITPRVTDVHIEGDQATITDCQDTSRAGQSDLATGTPKTVGIERNSARVTLIRESGVWRVSQLDFPGGPC